MARKRRKGPIRKMIDAVTEAAEEGAETAQDMQELVPEIRATLKQIQMLVGVTADILDHVVEHGVDVAATWGNTKLPISINLDLGDDEEDGS